MEAESGRYARGAFHFHSCPLPLFLSPFRAVGSRNDEICPRVPARSLRDVPFPRAARRGNWLKCPFSFLDGQKCPRFIIRPRRPDSAAKCITVSLYQTTQLRRMEVDSDIPVDYGHRGNFHKRGHVQMTSVLGGGGGGG